MFVNDNTSIPIFQCHQWEIILPQLLPQELLQSAIIFQNDLTHFSEGEQYFLLHLYNHSFQQRLLDVAFPAVNA